MYNFIYVVTTFVNVVLYVLQFLMLARAVLSWFPIDEDSYLVRFVTMLTEPVVLPIRLIFENFDGLNDFPIDISYITAFVILSAVQLLLPTVTL